MEANSIPRMPTSFVQFAKPRSSTVPFMSRVPAEEILFREAATGSNLGFWSPLCAEKLLFAPTTAAGAVSSAGAGVAGSAGGGSSPSPAMPAPLAIAASAQALSIEPGRGILQITAPKGEP